MKWIIVILIFLLIGSNTFWSYQLVDSGVTLSYRVQQTHELEETRKQLMLLLPVVAKNVKKKVIVKAATQFTDLEPFEKDGCTWVGWLGFKFGGDNQLSSVSPIWSYGGKDPCYPNF